MDKDAEFYNLRAAGAFLVSASLKDGKVNKLQITSEAGGMLKIILPWKGGGTIIAGSDKKPITSNVVEMTTQKGEKIIFQP